jgi:hypothetical protein
VRTAELVLVVIFTVVAICVVIAIGYEVMIEAFETYENRYRGRRRSVEADVGRGHPSP